MPRVVDIQATAEALNVSTSDDRMGIRTVVSPKVDLDLDVDQMTVSAEADEEAI